MAWICTVLGLIVGADTVSDLILIEGQCDLFHGPVILASICNTYFMDLYYTWCDGTFRYNDRLSYHLQVTLTYIPQLIDTVVSLAILRGLNNIRVDLISLGLPYLSECG